VGCVALSLLAGCLGGLCATIATLCWTGVLRGPPHTVVEAPTPSTSSRSAQTDPEVLCVRPTPVASSTGLSAPPPDEDLDSSSVREEDRADNDDDNATQPLPPNFATTRAAADEVLSSRDALDPSADDDPTPGALDASLSNTTALVARPPADAADVLPLGTSLPHTPTPRRPPHSRSSSPPTPPRDEDDDEEANPTEDGELHVVSPAREKAPRTPTSTTNASTGPPDVVTHPPASPLGLRGLASSSSDGGGTTARGDDALFAALTTPGGEPPRRRATAGRPAIVREVLHRAVSLAADNGVPLDGVVASVTVRGAVTVRSLVGAARETVVARDVAEAGVARLQRVAKSASAALRTKKKTFEMMDDVDGAIGRRVVYEVGDYALAQWQTDGLWYMATIRAVVPGDDDAGPSGGVQYVLDWPHYPSWNKQDIRMSGADMLPACCARVVNRELKKRPRDDDDVVEGRRAKKKRRRRSW